MMGGGANLDPLVGLEDPSKPLRSKLLAVPALRERYTSYVRQIAAKWLDWKTLGPLAAQYQSVIAADIALDNRKLDTTENFTKGVTEDRAETASAGGPPPGFGGPGFGPPGGGRGGRGGFNDAPRLSLKGFAEQRRAYLLEYK